jgi:hypothetical protein
MLLIVNSKSGEGRVLDIGLARAPLTIGREAGSDVELRDEKVSRHHAVIETDASGRVVLRDLGSRNGTFVDGARVSGSRVLRGGERLRIGDQELGVEAGATAAGPAPPMAALSRPGPPGAAADAAGAPVSRPSPPGAAADGAGAPADANLGASPSAPASRARRMRARIATRRGGLVLGAVALLALVGVGQLVLPGVAEDRLRSKLERYGLVRHLHIAATPAIKLLWHRADRVEVAMDSYHSEPGGHGSLADFLSSTRDAGKLDVSVGVLQSQLLTLHDVRLHKEGDVLLGSARLSQQDLSAALPAFIGLRPVSASAEGIVVQVSAEVFGQRVRAQVRVLADGGRVVVRPEGVPFASLATITVFHDSRVYVESLSAELRGQEYTLNVRARLR